MLFYSVLKPESFFPIGVKQGIKKGQSYSSAVTLSFIPERFSSIDFIDLIDSMKSIEAIPFGVLVEKLETLQSPVRL